jgi:CHAT domain
MWIHLRAVGTDFRVTGGVGDSSAEVHVREFDAHRAADLYRTVSTLSSQEGPGGGRDRFQAYAKAIGSELFEGVLSGFDRFISSSNEMRIVYDGIYFPLELAFDGEHFLCMRLRMSSYPEAGRVPRVRSFVPKNGPLHPINILSIGNLDDRAVRHFAASGGGCVVKPEGGLEDGLRKMNDLEFDIVHFAGHGIAEGPDSGVRLIVDDDDDRKRVVLNPASIMHAANRPHALVFLNACATGRLTSTPSHLTLASSFLMAGARSCIVATLPLLERSAALFATSFYEQLVQGANVGESLFIARRKTLFEMDDLMTALSYALFGDGRTVSTATSRPDRGQTDPFVAKRDHD